MFLTTAQFSKVPTGYYALRVANGKGFGHVDDVWLTVAPAANSIHSGISRGEFTQDYMALLDYRRNDILKELEGIVDDAAKGDFEGIVLLCYERHGEFCHRKLLFEWLRRQSLRNIEFMDEGQRLSEKTLEP